MAKAVKLADIAGRLGVSNVTVSKALSGQKGVSEEMREKIIRLADELGYRQPSAQRREAAGGSYNIGVLISERYLDKYDSFYRLIYQQVATEAVRQECFTMMEPVEHKAEDQPELPRMVQEQRVDGLLVIGRLAEGYLSLLTGRSGLPVVYLDFCDERQDTDAVISDSYYGAYRLTNYLYEMGHRKIAFVGTLRASGSINDRYFGYAKSLMEHGLMTRGDWIIGDRDETGQIDAERFFLLPEDMPTAFFCNCDLTASYLIRKLSAAGSRVPGDISVAGYDHFLYPGLCDVPLTTYEVDTKEMARRGVRMITKKIAGKDYRRGISIVEGHMVIKDSVRRIAEG